MLVLFSEGYTNKMVSDTLNLSIHTVASHRTNIQQKLEVTNSYSMITQAFRKGILT